MSDLKDFVSGQNIDRFLDQLGEPLEPERRETLLRLLTEEQDRLSHDREQLALARQRAAEVAGRVRRMKALAACYPPGADPRGGAASVVFALEQAQALIEGHYEQLRAQRLRERSS
jgi:hypothetical protein